MTEFKPKNNLDETVAKIVARKIREALKVGVRDAKKNAPALKRWVTKDDDLVRPEHREMHGVEIPENLRFVVRSPPYDRKHYGAKKFQLMREPRDREATPGLTANCRCELDIIPDGISRTIEADPVKVVGTKVIGKIHAKGPRLKDSEFGTDKDRAERFLGRALKAIKRWLNVGR